MTLHGDSRAKQEVSYTKYMSDVEMTHMVLVSFIDRFIHTQYQVRGKHGHSQMKTQIKSQIRRNSMRRWWSGIRLDWMRLCTT